MKQTSLVLVFAIGFLLLVTTNSDADTRIMTSSISYCESGETISNMVRQGERVEVCIKVLVSDEQEISLFSELNDVAFYLEEQKISDNNSLNLVLPPGTHNLRAIGLAWDMAEDGEEITLLGSYSIGRYITAQISSPYILKNTAYSYIMISVFLCAIITGLVVFFFTKGKLRMMKSTMVKKSEDQRKETREKVIGFVKVIAPNLNAEQKREAKELLRKLDEV